MGNDTPLAVLSERPQLLYNYFKQLFAQVTNPPVDAIREEIIMAIDTTIGPEGNLLEPTPRRAHQITLAVADPHERGAGEAAQLDAPKGRSGAGLPGSITLPILFTVADGGAGLERAIDDALPPGVARRSRGLQPRHPLRPRRRRRADAPIPALLAVAGVHHHLIREGTRTRVGLVLETGEPREVHHFALLIGYGAGAINPYLAFETHRRPRSARACCPDVDEEHAVKNYVKAVNKGVIKVISKMGISTIQSYRGAQIFEAIGLNQDFVDEYFTWTPSRIGGIGIDVIAEEVDGAPRPRVRRDRSTPHASSTPAASTSGAHDGEHHLFNPETIHKLQHACRTGDYRRFKEYTRARRRPEPRQRCTLRGLMELKPARTAGAARRGRAGRVDRPALQDRRDVATARSARRRTRRWRSP